MVARSVDRSVAATRAVAAERARPMRQRTITVTGRSALCGFPRLSQRNIARVRTLFAFSRTLQVTIPFRNQWLAHGHRFCTEMARNLL
jgi:hypothetical protein